MVCTRQSHLFEITADHLTATLTNFLNSLGHTGSSLPPRCSDTHSPAVSVEVRFSALWLLTAKSNLCGKDHM